MMKTIQKLSFVFVLCNFFLNVQAQSLVEYVNPFIGTSNFGATNPGAVLPAGMVSVCPFNVAGGETEFEKDSRWLSTPYVYENNWLTGFSHVNLSGVGCPELGSLLLMPTTGDVELDPKKYGSTYSDEKASPGYFSNMLDKYKIQAEMTSTLRTGLSRYTFPAGQSNILLNLGLGLTNETGAMLKVVSNSEIEGYKLIGTFCYRPEDVRPVYFVMQLSKPAQKYGVWKKMPAYKAESEWTANSDKNKIYENYPYEMAGDSIGVYFTYETQENESIEVKVGISYVSIENARENLQKEQSGFEFDKVKTQASNIWNEKLSRVQLQGGSKDDRTIFYTALYHLLLHPSILQDANGDYPAMGSGKIKNTKANRYTVFSLWDTYRNVHPLLTLIYPELQADMLNTMLEMYQESGWLPKWELLGMETDVMVGDPATPVIVDSYLRGIKNFDTALAYEAIKKAATQTGSKNIIRPGIDKYIELGYIPEDTYKNVWGTVSTTLEYNISDWNLAQMAKAMGKKADYKLFYERSLSYKKYFDKSTGMLRPRMKDGKWLEPFNPKAGANFEPVIGFVEGNAWQYRFYAPHDIKGLIKLLGGEKQFISALNQCFDDKNYDMANEPDINYAFLYNQVKGEEWRCQQKVRELINQYYKNTPDGLPGNDDTGTLSAWLIYSMIGIYPHCPGDMNYSISSPVFDKVTIQLNPDYYTGKNLVIETENNIKDNYYIDQIQVNDKPYKSYFIDHQTLTKGTYLKFRLKNKK